MSTLTTGPKLPLPILNPNEVKGFMGHKEANRPDRTFHVLDVIGQKDYVWELDGYCIKNGVTGREMWRIVMLCPICQKSLTIDSEKKQLEVNDDGIEVESFGCAWPGDFSSPCCNFRAGIAKPRGDQRMITTSDGVTRKIDGVFRRA